MSEGVNKSMCFKILTSLIFVAIFLIRLFKPDINIDNTSIVLLLLALAPWFIQYIKTLEINGVGKVELVNTTKKKEIEQKVDNAGINELLPNEKSNIRYTFYNLRYNDPKLALAGLRIEIENSLRKIAVQNDIDDNYKGIGKMTETLSQHQLIDNDERSLISDITGILNKAVHSQIQEYNDDSIDWVFDMGLKILNFLEQKKDNG